MSKKIIFQKCNINNIYFLFYAIISFINIFIEYNFKLFEEGSNKNILYLPVKIFDDLYIQNLSDFLAIIPHLIRKRLLKKKQEKISSVEIEGTKDSEDSKLIYNDKNISITNKKKKTILLYCIIVGILDFFEKFALILYFIIFTDKEFDVNTFSCVVPFEIICQFICSFIILKIHFYKLQYFSLFLNLGIFIIILIIDIIYYSKNDETIWRLFFFYIFNVIFYSIEYSLGKKIFLYGFISVYLLIIIKGSVVLILSLLLSLITFLVNKDIFIRMGFFFKKSKYIWLFIAKIFSSFFYTMINWLIIDKFSPNYLPLSLLIYEFCYFIIELIYDPKIIEDCKWDFYIRIILYLISFIGVMIHNEIVVINICNLGSDTKYFLDLEVKNEELFANADNPEIIKRFDSLVEMPDDEQYNENDES